MGFSWKNLPWWLSLSSLTFPWGTHDPFDGFLWMHVARTGQPRRCSRAQKYRKYQEESNSSLTAPEIVIYLLIKVLMLFQWLLCQQKKRQAGSFGAQLTWASWIQLRRFSCSQSTCQIFPSEMTLSLFLTMSQMLHNFLAFPPSLKKQKGYQPESRNAPEMKNLAEISRGRGK